jgi:cysteinyl-tRNA synthetase
MAEQILGLDFEVHGGGSDLVFPHHENEIAQTEAGRGAPLARIWMHNGMLQFEDEKMSKSVGNVRGLGEALDAYGRDALVMFMVSGHYRGPLAFSPSAMADARASVERVRELCRRLDPAAPAPESIAPYAERFFDALARDFHTEIARRELFDWVSEANRRIAAGEAVGVGDLGDMLRMLGLEGLLEQDADERPDPEAERKLAEREAARARRDFAAADACRDELEALGWEVRDTPEGARLLRRR